MSIQPVTWKPPRGVTAPWLAVACGGCNVAIGEPCKPGWHGGSTSRDRIACAEVRGFCWSPGAAPAPAGTDALPLFSDAGGDDAPRP